MSQKSGVVARKFWKIRERRAMIAVPPSNAEETCFVESDGNDCLASAARTASVSSVSSSSAHDNLSDSLCFQS